ncbi:MAG TPA: hypothetical protein ENK84_13040 [Desulfobulbus sp.]|nr:hypothetical protein [Desulfobulbus sp.]
MDTGTYGKAGKDNDLSARLIGKPGGKEKKLKISKDVDIRRLALNNTTTLLNAIKPQNELEGMLATQMLSIHDLLMKQVRRCTTEDRADVVNLKINQIMKLSQTFIAQVDALNKHRGKGQQKITVEGLR